MKYNGPQFLVPSQCPYCAAFQTMRMKVPKSRSVQIICRSCKRRYPVDISAPEPLEA